MDAFRHVTPPPLQTQQKPRVTEAQHNAEKHSLSNTETLPIPGQMNTKIYTYSPISRLVFT